VFNLRFEIEHIIPISLGGVTELENLALSCHSCKLYKSNQINAFDEETNEEIRLFNPRLDIWTEHFSFQNGELFGLTAIGRVTISSLKINSELQIEARRQWQRLGLMN